MLAKGELTRAENYFNKALGSSAIVDVEIEEEKGEKIEKTVEDEQRLKMAQKRKEKRQKRRQKKMIKKHGFKDPKTLDPERWIPMQQRKKNQKKGGKK